MQNHSRKSRISQQQLLMLSDVLLQNPEEWGLTGCYWTRQHIASIILRLFGISYQMSYIPKVMEKIWQILDNNNSFTPYFSSSQVTLYCGDAVHILTKVASRSVDCVITSPPYYGQRDYGVPGQIGLEAHPQLYIDRLMIVFEEVKRILKPGGSLWVNLGDTYWSGKGQPHGHDAKQKNRRFLRPQDRTGTPPLCVPKQLLLIPHRFAIAMQESGWIVRNDNVWYKQSPMPDPVDDRCAATHEYMFHFVLSRRYYFDYQAVAVPSKDLNGTKAPPSVWAIPTAPSHKQHVAVFPESLVRLPILATCPPHGVLLDPFCGSGTALHFAIAQGEGRKAIGVDISMSALAEARRYLEES